MLDKLKNLSSLKKLLTKENLGYLDVTLSILTGGQAKSAYKEFWKEFNLYFPGDAAPKAAWVALTGLHRFIRKELNAPHE